MRALLVDDHRLVVEGLTNLLEAHGIEVVGVASDGWQAVAEARRARPDLVLMDIKMPHCDGLAATRLIKAEMPDVTIVMLTTSAEDDDLFEAVKSGACGYLLKSASGQQFIDSLAGLEQGIPPFSPGLASRVLKEFARLASSANAPVAAAEKSGTSEPRSVPELTPRQIEVLKAVAEGLTYREVGARLALSERTVRYHMAEIMYRLHLEHRNQVLAYAARMGLNSE